MTTIITDKELEKRLRFEREKTGADRYDEVWERTYMMAPMPNDEHQQIVNRFASIFQDVIDWPGLGDVRPGVNVSDRIDDWKDNYRVPDVAVFLVQGSAVNHGTFWFGGPDFAVEVISTDDHTLEKVPFYESVSVRELLLIHRAPWELELLRLDAGRLRNVANSPATPILQSHVIPFSFRLVPGDKRPRIEVVSTTDARKWLV